MEDVFPLKQGIDYTKLTLTEEGSYSVTRRRDADRILTAMKQILHTLDNKSITDATGCVGGDTIHFGLNFKQVESIELKKENYLALKNNVSIYGLTNVNFHLGDATELFNWKTDVLYVDPPWGGPDYKEKKDLDLYMSSKRIDKWLEEILLRKNRPNYIFLKLPSNYNFKRLNFLSNVEYIKPFRIRSYILVAINVHVPNQGQNR
jgi:predicted RNA methylase